MNPAENRAVDMAAASLAATTSNESWGIPGIEPGTVLKHYEIIRQLGAGGMGIVFLARDTRLGRLVAVKFLLDVSGPAVQRFLTEARTTAECRHENIVVIYDVDEVHGYPYMVLEYIDGRTLRAVMTEHERSVGAELIASWAVELVLPVVKALACAHEMGIVHRDLKPENILLTNTGFVKVLDFGIAKRVSSALASTIQAARAGHIEGGNQTQDGLLVGTMPYMSPEQWQGDEIDARTDIWAVGVILFEMLVGEHPLAPASLPQLLTVVDLDVPMPSARAARPDAGLLGDVIDHCLKKRKAERIATARALLDELQALGHDGPAASIAKDESPFAGLAAFQESDASRFFGRENDVAAVIGKLRNQPLVAIAGPSGAGKSSFIRAGVIPALKRSAQRVETFVVRPGRRPLAALADVLAFLADTAAKTDTNAEIDPETVASMLRTQPGYFGARLRARCRRRAGEHRILIVVDQLEELYTLGIDSEERAAFYACIEGVADDAASPLRVIVTIRADFLDRLAGDRRFMAEVTQGLVFLPPMGRDGLRDALTRPLVALKYQFEDESLVDEMVDSLDGTRCPLPLLQFTATKLWEARDRQRRLLTRDAYRSVGGVAGALSTHADAVLSGLTLPEQRLARSVFIRLVTPERTRAIVRMDELVTLDDEGSLVEQVVHRLAGARLLLIEAGDDQMGKTVELAHESLIERWVRFRQWLDEDEHDAQFLTQLRTAAQQWQKNGEPDGLLWRDRAALEAGHWLARRRAERGAEATSGLGKGELRYLQAVITLAERMRRWRMLVAAVVIGALAVIAVAVSVLAFHAHGQALRANEQARRADDQAKHAQQEARQARNATRMAAAREMQHDPTSVLAVLREAEEPDVPRGWSELTRWALYAGVARSVLSHPDGVAYAAWSPDGQTIVTASRDNKVRSWNANGMAEPTMLRGHENHVWSAAFSPDGKFVASASSDKTALVQRADGTGEPVILRGHTDVVWTAMFDPGGQHVLTASLDRTARIWKTNGSGEPVILRGHAGGIRSAAFSPDGKHIVTASFDKTARVWTVDGTKQPVILLGHADVVSWASWSPDGKRIVTASWDRTIRVWDAEGTGKPLIIHAHDDRIHSAFFSPDGRRILTASQDKTVRLWNAHGAREPLILRGHDDFVWSAEFTNDGKRIVTASTDTTARVYEVDGTGDPKILRGHDEAVVAVAIHPSGKRIASASYDKTARLWDESGAGEPLVFRGHEGPLASVAFSPSGERMVTASYDSSARVWNVNGQDKPIVLEGHTNAVRSAAFVDEQRIVTASHDGTARVWNADGTGNPLVLRGHTDQVVAVAVDPSKERLITTSMDGTARLSRVDGTGESVVFRGHEGPIWSAAWSPDGKRVATGSHDKTTRIWSADGSSAPIVLRGHEHWVLSVAWSPDGKRIVTASQDKTVRVWNADGTGMLLVLRGNAAFNHASWTPDGNSIVASSDDKTISIWSDLEPVHGILDARLWKATTYCMPIDRRIKILGLPSDVAEASRDACRARVGKVWQGEAR